jgi:phospholipase C
MFPNLMIALLGAAALVVVANTSTKQAAGSLADIKHVVLFMQENRAFDHVIIPILSYRICGDC